MRVWQTGHGGQERVGLGGRAGRDPQVAGQPDVADEDAGVEQRLPRRGRVGEAAEEDEVRVAGDGRVAQRAQLGDDPVALLLDRLDGAQQARVVLERGERDGLGRVGQVVGQADQPQRVEQRGRAGEVADPAPARAKALLIVRVTTSSGWASRRVTALGVPGRANSA